ncbi:hypothetical protein D9Q98_001951 [Chlorella vulgaris]|uniref:Helix-hairpin-helix DNA-binding motif class 1 domain-containing protein n=1 Tax=Chlorella vulgaris TaxID=3077 RepID=A0A9D4TVI0_CHLVU|nr:hypothetical protein D9Q98_001951 [Chlorella vulgaris]
MAIGTSIGIPAGLAAARLERSVTGAAASTSGRALRASSRLPASRQLWAAAAAPAGRRNRQQVSRLSQAAAAGTPGEWLPAAPGGASRLHTTGLAPTVPQPEVQPVHRLPSGEPMAPPASYGGSYGMPASGPLYGNQCVNRAGASPVNLPARPPPARLAPAAGSVKVQGTVQKVTFRSPDTGYTVFRLQVAADVGSPQDPAAGSAAASQRSVKGKRSVITVVGNLQAVAVGQSLLLSGSWVDHKQYGQQLRVDDVEELTPSTDCEMVAYLGGGALAGVGPVTAQRMVDKWGTDIESKLNSRSAVQYLTQCEGIKKPKAEKIKQAWDATQGTREGVIFLKEHGISLPLAQRVAKRHGPHTVARVKRDAYHALAGFGLPFSKVDMLAGKVDAPPDLVSRAAMALQQCLAAAASQEGHTYLPWHRLEQQGRHLLRDVGLQHNRPWQHDAALHLVAQHMHSTGALVAERQPEEEGAAAEPFGAQLDTAAGQAAAAHAASVQQAQGVAAGQAAAPAVAAAAARPPRVHPRFDGIADLQAYLADNLPGVSAGVRESLLNTYGERVLAVLDADPSTALPELSKCRKVGEKTAEKIKLAWERAHGGARLFKSGGKGGKGGAAQADATGLTMQELQARPPTLGFGWTAGTRCYTPQLHAAELAVAERSLQKAALHRQPSAGQASKVRKWVAANQSTTDVQLSEGQVRAMEVASDSPLMVMTGGPGCGKTTAVQTIVKLWAAQKKLVCIAAPTGRAAQRMGSIQGIEPSTIHRLLGYQPRGSLGGGGGGGGGSLPDPDAAADEAEAQGVFQYNRHNPLPANAVLVDEASMLSLPLAAALFDALHPKCQLVLVGDVDQLPPVGPGSVLQSLIASRLVPVVDLREIFRQAAESAIITSALAVRRGDVPLLQRVAPHCDALQGSSSDALMVCATPEGLSAAVRDTVVALLQAHALPAGGEAGPELQVITPMRKGPAGTSALNPMLQALLNPPSRSKAEISRTYPHGGSGSGGGGGGGGDAAADGRVFRMGDRVLQTVNNYEKEVFNGDQGWVVACNPGERKLVVRFPHLDDSEARGGLGSLRDYRGVELGQLELAYAITVHKAQGGEAEHVVLALSPQHGRMLTRRLLYTGLTRARRQLVVVNAGGGSGPDPLATAVRCDGSDQLRLTSLQLRLEQGRAAGGLPELQVQSYSNEEKMLAQAAQWQAQQAQHQAAAHQQVEEQQQGVAAEDAAEHWQDTWAAGSSGSGGAGGSGGLVPSLAQLAAVQEQLLRHEGCSPEVASLWVRQLQQQAPGALLDWGRAMAACAWLQQQLPGSLSLADVVLQAPQLLAVDEGRLRAYWRFLDSRPDFEASTASSSGSVLEALHVLRCSAGKQAPPQLQKERVA